MSHTLIDYNEIARRLNLLINNAKIVVDKDFIEYRNIKVNESNYELGELGIDYELLEWWLLHNKLVKPKDTTVQEYGTMANFWPDFNIVDMRIDNKCINSIWFPIKPSFVDAVNAGLVTHILFYKDNRNKAVLLQEGDIVTHTFVGIAKASDVIEKKIPGEFAKYVVNVENFFKNPPPL
jgi:hypothetical protein